MLQAGQSGRHQGRRRGARAARPGRAPGDFNVPVRIAVRRDSDQKPAAGKFYQVPATVGLRRDARRVHARIRAAERALHPGPCRRGLHDPGRLRRHAAAPEAKLQRSQEKSSGGRSRLSRAASSNAPRCWSSTKSGGGGWNLGRVRAGAGRQRYGHGSFKRCGQGNGRKVQGRRRSDRRRKTEFYGRMNAAAGAAQNAFGQAKDTVRDAARAPPTWPRMPIRSLANTPARPRMPCARRRAASDYAQDAYDRSGDYVSQAQDA